MTKPLSYPSFASGVCIKIAVVLTRDVVVGSGRTTIIAKMLEGLSRDHDVSLFRLHSLMETRSLSDIAAAFAIWLWSLMRGRSLSLQCLLYASRAECTRLAEVIRVGGFTAVYLDTVRCQMLLRTLRRTMPGIHIVTDFDDLMSRRMRFLAEHRLPLLTGHTSATFPAWLRRMMEGPLARLITGYEAATLHHAEDETAAASDAVVLTSAKECEALQKRLGPCGRALLHAIPPPMDARAAPWTTTQSFRFVFIGSDRLLQNRIAIDHLLERWRILKPATPLHIYSAQTRALPDVGNVHWHGFVEDLSEVYQPGSALLLPSLVSGGIKTKIAEAWSFGCPVLGNDAAFEGLEIQNYPLNLPEALWSPLLTHPESHMNLWSEAAELGHDFVVRHLSVQQFHRAWSDTMMDGAITSVELTPRLDALVAGRLTVGR